MVKRLTAFDYVPLDERPQEPRDTRTVRERLAIDIKATMSCASAVTAEHWRRHEERGLVMPESTLGADARERAHIRVAERNHYPGQMFAEEIYLWWKAM